jgi:hypothetical protein
LLEIRISTSWGSYSISDRCFGVVEHNFYGFLKISSSISKPKGVSLRFYQKMSFHNKNWSKIRISSPWGLYFCSVRHYGVVHKFFEVQKNIEFWVKTQRGEPSVLPTNVRSRWKWTKICISSLWDLYYVSIRYFGDVNKFLGVLKNIEFRLKTQRCYHLVLPKNVCSWWKQAKSLYFILVRPIFCLS